jgi:hypothetical protein
MAAHPKGYWENRVKTLIKIELTKQDLSYKDLAEKLHAIGVPETEPNVRNKLSRGTFSAMFLVQCLEAMGLSELRLK